MLKFLVITLLSIFSLFAYSEETSYLKLAKDNILNVSVTQQSPGTSTYYTVNKGRTNEEELNFETIGIPYYLMAIDTTWLEIGFTVPSSDDNEEIQKTRYHFFSLGKSFGKYKLSFASSVYRGAYINTTDLTASGVFYSDFRGDSKVIQLDYYNDLEYKNALDSPVEAQKQRAKTGDSYFDSMILNAGHRKTRTNFPELKNIEINSFFNNLTSVEDYITYLETENSFMTIGYGGYHLLTDNFNYYFHLNYGLGYQNLNSETDFEYIQKTARTTYMEIGLGIGYLINKKHHLGFSSENAFEESDINTTYISNTQRLFSFFYKYFF